MRCAMTPRWFPRWRATRATPHRDRRHRSADQVPTRDIKTVVREQLQTLEASRQEKWDAIRAIWAGDGG